MPCGANLDLTRTILANLHINSHIVPQDEDGKYIDGGLRAYFNMLDDYNNLFVNQNFDIEDNTDDFA